ncbi:hypothetical protein SETIT_5G012600v2 [Setaria italica]|uniref:Uncharacterized protein n=1 Tax=Setaria italica TaxID=4555 RepID=A0A368QZZ7_SETIT|nr:hypothetical protein SETIT_5G012600v2 [Setaria italica]
MGAKSGPRTTFPRCPPAPPLSLSFALLICFLLRSSSAAAALPALRSAAPDDESANDAPSLLFSAAAAVALSPAKPAKPDPGAGEPREPQPQQHLWGRLRGCLAVLTSSECEIRPSLSPSNLRKTRSSRPAPTGPRRVPRGRGGGGGSCCARACASSTGAPSPIRLPSASPPAATPAQGQIQNGAAPRAELLNHT